MSEKSPRRQAAEEWLARAAGHLKTARHIAAAPDLPPADAAFHAQQAAECSLKAFLAAHGAALRRTHDLFVLAQQCRDIDESFPDFGLRATSLTTYAVEARYPPFASRVTTAEAMEAIAFAEDICRSVRTRLGLPDVSSAGSTSE
jgi:HEPN domain-containing protein